MKLLYHIEDEYTTLKMVEDESASFEVPTEWQGTSYMSYIPDQYRLYQILSFAEYHRAEYSDSFTGKVTLKYSELGMSIESNIDTEDAEIIEVDINNYIGVLTIKGSDCSVFWCDGRQYYLLSAKNSAPEELLEIARSVEKIK